MNGEQNIDFRSQQRSKYVQWQDLAKIASIVLIYVCYCTGKPYSSHTSTVYLIMVYYFSNLILRFGLSSNKLYRNSVNSLGESTGSGIPHSSMSQFTENLL